MCEICGKTFVRKSTLNRNKLLHKNEDEIKNSFLCEQCGHSFTRKDQFQELLKVREALEASFEDSSVKFCTKFNLKVHMR